jgi:hypothetical protein
MNEMKRTIFAGAIIGLMLGICAGYYAALMVYQHRSPKATVNVFVFKETAEGIELLSSGNVITDIGEDYVRDALSAGGTINQTKWISLSNDASPVQTWTKLPNELTNLGFARALGTVTQWTSGTDYAYNVTKKFTATGAVTAQCAGLQWNDVLSDNNLFACAAFTQTVFAANDNCTIVWMIVIDAN